MKRMILFFLVTVMISIGLVYCAYAETDFSVRGGITFDSSKGEILAFEESQGSRIDERHENKYYYTNNCIYCEGISFAGYDNAAVIYYFDKDDKLISIIYLFHQYVDDKDSGDKLFRIIDDGLEKYGNPVATGNEFIDINKEDRDVLDMFSNFYLDISSDAKTKLISFSQRLYPLNEGCIDIKNIEFLWQYSQSIMGYKMQSNQYYVGVSYSLCTKDQLQAVHDAINQKQNAINNDL